MGFPKFSLSIYLMIHTRILPGIELKFIDLHFQGSSINIWLFFLAVPHGMWPEKAMAPHSSTLAWKIPWAEEPGRLQSMGSLRVDTTERFHFHFSLSCIGEGNGNPLQCSCLENPRDGEAWWAVYGVAQSWTQLKWLSSSLACDGFPGSPDSKVSACSAGDPGLITGSGRSPGKGNGYPLQYYCLENSMDGGAWEAIAHGVAKSRTQMSD